MSEKDQFVGLTTSVGVLPALVYGVQHVLAMFVGIITPPLLVAAALGLSPAETGFFVSMAIFASGLTTFIQVRRFGPLGSGLLSVQGTTVVFIPLAIQAGQLGGLPLIFGMTILVSPVEMITSRFLGLMRRLFPPVVSGSVVILIGVSLVRIGMTDLAGGFGAQDLGSLSNLFLGFLVIGTIVSINQFSRKLGPVSIVLGLVVGYLAAVILGRVDFTPVREASWISLPVPFRYGVSFETGFILPWAIAYLVTTIESIGDLTATSEASREPVDGPIFVRRLQRGVLADGVGSFLAGVFNSMPNTTFSQNNGLIRITEVASRHVGLMVAGILCFLGLLPKLAALVSVMPKPVLGGATVIMFSMVAISGIRIVQGAASTIRNDLIIALTIAMGIGVTMVPEALTNLSTLSLLGSFRLMFQSGLAMGALTAVFLNLVLPEAID